MQETRERMMLSPDFQFDEALHQYVVDNELQPNVTRMLEHYGLIDYSDVPADTLMRKQLIGKAVHKITHVLEEDELSLNLAVGQICDAEQNDFEEYEIFAEELLGYCFGWLRFLEESDFVRYPGYIEKRHVAEVNGMRYGMTIDRAGRLRKRPTILDLKCTATREKSWPVQLAGYALGLPKPVDVVRWERSVVWLKPDGKYSLCPGGRTHTDPIIERRDEEVFLAVLRLTHWKAENFGRHF